jgi:glycosyltransferase involved in cell wall biosynthesis
MIVDPAHQISTPRVAVMLDGDPRGSGAAQTKFGLFVDAVAAATDVVGSYDLTLDGPGRLAAAAVAWRPNRRAWKEHYRKNPLTFQLRSRQARGWLRSLQPAPDVALHVGAMSNPHVEGIPFALYLDFTFALTRREWPARVPMSAVERPLWRRLESRTYDDARLIFCRSEHLARSLRGDYGVPDAKIRVVGAGVNVPLPDLDDLPPRTEPRAVFIGSDFRRKGGDIVLRAWPAVREAVPDAVLTMIGPVPTPLPDGVETNHGRWDPDWVLDQLRRATLFVMPSRCETFGDVFVEAMAYGVPCIGSTNDAMPEIILDGETGFVVPPDDPDALAARMIELLSNRDLARRFGTAGRHRVEERYVWDKVIAAMLPDLRAIAAANRTHFQSRELVIAR